MLLFRSQIYFYRNLNSGRRGRYANFFLPSCAACGVARCRAKLTSISARPSLNAVVRRVRLCIFYLHHRGTRKRQCAPAHLNSSSPPVGCINKLNELDKTLRFVELDLDMLCRQRSQRDTRYMLHMHTLYTRICR